MRTFHHSEFPPSRVAAERGEATIDVCVPARECAATIGPIVEALGGLREAGAIDEVVVVVDAASEDGTGEIAAAAGARVVQEASLDPELGPVRGKGDAMYRALGALSGDVACFVDGDSEGFDAHFACGLVGPLVCDVGAPAPRFVKAAYRRPFTAEQTVVPDGGGRVSQLLARPLLTMFYPALAGIVQPLAGEVAATRELLLALPFATGYAVEIAMLIDALALAGPDAIVQCDLGERVNAHQSLAALTPMAWAVLNAVVARLEREGRVSEVDPATLLVPVDGEMVERRFELVERPPRGS